MSGQRPETAAPPPPREPPADPPDSGSGGPRGSTGTYLLTALVALAGFSVIGGLVWFTIFEPARKFKPLTVRTTFERDALGDVLPPVNLEEFISRDALRAYADSGNGLELTFVIRNDPRKGYADSTARCGIEQAASYNYPRKPRQRLVDSTLVPRLRECARTFLAPIPRAVPVNILVDVTEGVDDELEATLARAIEEQGLVGRLTESLDTVVLMASLIFDHDFSVYESWSVQPGTDSDQAGRIAAKARAWLTRERAPLPASTVSIGLLNGFALRGDRGLRGGLVLVVSDGMQLSRSGGFPDSISFYRGVRDPSYLDRRHWPRFDRQILEEYGTDCPSLHGARVVWYSPPRERQPIRAVLDYWGHFLTEKCNAGSYLSRF